MKRILGIAAALVAASAFQASAQQASGFYLRADVGGAFSTHTDFTDTVPPSDPTAVIGAPGGKISGDAGNSVIFGGGFGYRYTPALRVDVTASYMPSFKFNGTDNVIGTTDTADVKSLVGLVNGYVDINGLVPNLLGPLQPYVTAGIGVARNEVGPMTTTLGGVSATISGATHTSLAWGVGAGVAYPIGRNLAVDVGYKYLDLGEMRTGTTGAVVGVTVPLAPTKADLHVHTVTVGLRFGF